jgi:16S rRNA (guanine527-N7)-methyltransferase
MPISSEIIEAHFPDLNDRQKQQFAELKPLYDHWNAQINVISRKDMDEFYAHHVLHSLGIAKITRFAPDTHLLDIGTGGGFPGIPLAILYPECRFHLIDSIGKKIKVVNEVSQALELSNVIATHGRCEELPSKHDFIISRAVAPWEDIYRWTHDKLRVRNQNTLTNGWILLKGGDLKEEFRSAKRKKEFALSDYFSDPFFETKKVIYVPGNARG